MHALVDMSKLYLWVLGLLDFAMRRHSALFTCEVLIACVCIAVDLNGTANPQIRETKSMKLGVYFDSFMMR